jgi:hypothetical protein
MSTPEFKNLLCTYGAAAFDKQIQLSDLIANRSFQVDLNQGHIEFCGGDSLTIPIQLLGTESDGDSTWLWSWANSASNLPENLVRVAVPDHWTAFVSNLKFYRIDHTVEDGQVVARSGKSQLTAEFDELHRLKRIQGQLQSNKELH